jgi:peptide/nickel transport system substrate-binding protein
MKFSRLIVLTLLTILMLTMGSLAGAQDGFTVIIGWEQEPDLPEIVSGSAFSEYLDEWYARDVWDWDTERNIYPIMVEEIPSLENGLVTLIDLGDIDGDGVADQAPQVTYRLRQGMLWSNGEPITAADCMFFHNLVMQPNAVDSFQRGQYPDVVASAEQVDDYTVVLTYNRPWPDFLFDAVLSCAYPANRFLGDNEAGFTMDADGDGVFDANLDDSPYVGGFQDPSQLIGYGPYIMSEYNAGQGLTFTRNPNWGINEWEVVPAVDTFILQFILESEQMENAMEVGDIDVAFNFDAVNNGYGTLENVSVFTTEGVYVDAVWLNSGPNAFPAVQDVRVREAIYHGIDRRGIANQFAGGGAGETLPHAWVPAQFTPPDLPFREFDQALARQLLDEAGWLDDDGDESADNTAPTPRVAQGVEGVADGTAMILRFYTTPVLPRPDIQVVMQAQLQQIGIRTQLFVVNGPTVLFAPYSSRGILYTGEYDIAMYALSNLPLSPNGALDNFQCRGIPSAENPEGRNNTWFCNEEYDRLDNLVASTNDPALRLQYRFESEVYFYNAAVWGAIRTRPEAYAVRTDVLNVESTMRVGTLSGNYFQHVEQWQPAS